MTADTDKFIQAVKCLDRGETDGLERRIAECPELLGFRCRAGGWYADGYFAGAALIHHVAGNPIRCPLPPNITDVIDLLLRLGADPNAQTDAAWSPIGLILTSKQASDAGVALALIDRLKAAGAEDDLEAADMLSGPLWNEARGTAEALARRGAPMDLRHRAALGRIERIQQLLRDEPAPQALLLEEALVFACRQGEVDAARLLLDLGAKGDVVLPTGGEGVSQYAAGQSGLHTAASRGDISMIGLLLQRGANPTVAEPTYGGTPRAWAEHCGHAEAAQCLRRADEMYAKPPS